MNSKQLTQAIAIFVVLLIAGLLMILLPHQLDLGQVEVIAALRNSLPLIGTALLSAGVVFFLLEMTRLERDKQSN